VKKISLVVPVFNEEAGISEFLRVLQSVITSLKKEYKFEVIMIDDGSHDSTYIKLSESHITGATLKIIKLASNSGHQSALMAGIIESQGDCIITMDSDLQHPPEYLHKFLSSWNEGFEIVQGIRTSTNSISWMKQKTSYLFYKIFNIFSSNKIRNGSSDFRLIDKVVYSQIQQLFSKSPNRDFMLRAFLPTLNCRTKYIEFSSPERKFGNSSFTNAKMLRLAFSGFISYSKFPIALISVAISIYLLFLLGYSLVVTSLYFTSQKLPPGITSLVLLVTISTLIQLTASLLILLICYRIYQEKISIPRFIVKSRTKSK
jgi:dolichol-phosphate mannosyltransferase